MKRGNARHPARDEIAPEPKGPTRGRNTHECPVLVAGPSAQAVAMSAGLGVAVNTASPMSSGMRFWAGDTGFGVNRMTGRIDPRAVKEPVAGISNAQGAISPVARPQTVRVGAQSGPSSAPAYPSTGADAGFGSALAWMSLKQTGPGIGG